MASLAVRCKHCGAQVFTGIRTGWVSRPVMGLHALPCRQCGQRADYHSTDLEQAG